MSAEFNVSQHRMNSSPDLVGTFRLLAIGGKSQPAYSGYRPAHKLHDNYLSSGEHFYPEKGVLQVGECATVEVKLITPHVYPSCVWPGRTLEVFEGGKLVGFLEVSEVRNHVLLGSANSYRPIWEAQPGLKRDTG